METGRDEVRDEGRVREESMKRDGWMGRDDRKMREGCRGGEMVREMESC